MTVRRPGREKGLSDVPDFGGAMTGLHHNRVTQILRWARDNRQSWLLEFFDRRLAGADPRNPQTELVAALTEHRLTAANEGLVIACDGGRILFVNSMATELIASAAWLVEQDGHLKGATPTLDAKLHSAVTAALSAQEGDPPTWLRLEARRTGELLLLSLNRLQMADTDGTRPPFVTIYMLHEAASPELDEASLICWYGLSASEARLAVAFASGVTLAAYADSHGVTINTVRTLFARLKSKMGATDQAAVVRKVLLAATRA